MRHDHPRNRLVLLTAVLCTISLLAVSAASQSRGGAAGQQPPPPLPPGMVDDGTYSFEYFSGYDIKSRLYRRYILNKSPHEVRFDWPQVELGGRAPSGRRVFHEGPLEPEPKVSAGQLFYDYRRTRTNAYSLAPPGLLTKLQGALISVLEGFIDNARGDLQPVVVRMTSGHAGETFTYTISNESEIPIRIFWAEFAKTWIQTAEFRNAYRDQFATLMKEQAVTGQSDASSFVLNAGRNATWNLTSPRGPALFVSRFEVMGAGSSNAELYGAVLLYLPFIST